MLKRIKQLRELSANEWKVLFVSLFLLPTIATSLHLLGYKKTKSTLSFFMPSEEAQRPALDHELQQAHSTANIISIVARHNVYKATCLKQVLLLWFLLGRKSIQSEIKIGIPIVSTTEFNAHAWLECNGELMIDSKDTINKFSAF